MLIPPSVIGTTAPIIAERNTHAELNSLFYSAGFGGDPPDGNKLHKCQEWLRAANKFDPENALVLFGKLIAEFMDTEVIARPSFAWNAEAKPTPESRSGPL